MERGGRLSRGGGGVLAVERRDGGRAVVFERTASEYGHGAAAGDMVTMDRITGVSQKQAGWIAKLIYRALKRSIGLVPKSKTLTAHHTPTLIASTWMDAIVAPARAVPIGLK